MDNAELNQPHEPLLAHWRNPAKTDSVAREVWNVFQSTVTMLELIATRVVGKGSRGDGVVTHPAAMLLATPAGREMLIEYIRLCSNQLQIICAEFRSIAQPLRTFNFVVSETLPIPGDLEQNELQLKLPEQCAVENRAETQRKLNEFAALLRQRGFVAYKDSHILLNPRTHFAVAMIYDKDTEKICLHIRDTASDGFWERGSWVNWVADLQQGVGLVPEVYALGDMFVRGCVEIFGPENLQLSGYSMGGGIGIFAGARNFVPAVVFNPAFLSPHHVRFLPDGWRDFAKEHIQVLSVSNDVLSRQLDNPETGGIFPTELFEGAQVYVTDPADEARGLASELRNSIHGHYLSVLLFGLLRTAMQDPELCKYAWQTLIELPQEVQAAFVRQNAPLFTQLLQALMLPVLATQNPLMSLAQFA
ncbi:MAG: hypothetical protein LBB26_02440 [Puniceicoccales bacterium]|jgi:hypothetical protein|nr:hypothetical protein [Puniceicoccales bacterium]